MLNWKDRFEKKTLARGWEYYEGAMVWDFCKTDDGYAAVCEGSEAYDVEITMTGDRVEEMRCTCPHGEKGFNCKHMAAVLYTIELGAAEDPRDRDCIDDAEVDPELPKEPIPEIIARLPRETLELMLEDAAGDSEELCRRILLFSDADGRSISARRRWALDRLYRELTEEYERDRSHGRSLFCEDDDDPDYCAIGTIWRSYESLLRDQVRDLLSAGECMEAFDLIRYAMEEMHAWTIPDPDRAREIIADNCVRLWREIIDAAEENEKEQLRSRLEAWAMDPGAPLCKKALECIRAAFAEPPYTEGTVKLLRQVIDRENEEDPFRYRKGSLVVRMIELLQTLPGREEEISALRREYHDDFEVRDQEILDAEEAGDFEDAIRLLKAAKKDFDPYLQERLSRRLIEIYERLGRTEELYEELCTMVFDLKGGGMEMLTKLKGVCTPKQWKELRSRYIADEKMPCRRALMEER